MLCTASRHVLLWHARRPAFAATDIRIGYLAGAGWFSFVLLTYPVAWGCAEGANVVSVTSEMIWYGVLDLLAGPVFLAVFFSRLRRVEYAALGLQSGKWTEQSAAAAVAAAKSGAVVVDPAATTAPVVPAPMTMASNGTATTTTTAPVVNGTVNGAATTAPVTTAA